MDLKYAVLSSGSIGNSYVFSDGTDSIIVDCGISAKQMHLRLESAGVNESTIRAIFITHLHPDHVNGVRVFTKGTSIPIYLNAFSLKRIPTVVVKYGIPTTLQKYFNINEEVSVSNAFEVYPFELYHDCIGTVGYKIKSLRANKSVVIITDTGKYNDTALELSNDADALFLESNYDDDMLRNGPYSIDLQNRIKGERGHLSNEQAVNFVSSLNCNNKRKIHLIHVSSNNNSTAKIYKAFENIPNEQYSSLVALERGEFYKGVV